MNNKISCENVSCEKITSNSPYCTLFAWHGCLAGLLMVATIELWFLRKKWDAKGNSNEKLEDQVGTRNERNVNAYFFNAFLFHFELLRISDMTTKLQHQIEVIHVKMLVAEITIYATKQKKKIPTQFVCLNKWINVHNKRCNATCDCN